MTQVSHEHAGGTGSEDSVRESGTRIKEAAFDGLVKEIQRLRKELEAAETLVSLVNHDLRGFLRNIKLATEIIEQNASDKQSLEAAACARRSADNAQRFLDSVSSYVKSGGNPSRSWTFVETIIDEAIRSVKSAHGCEDCTFVVSSEMPDAIYADHELVLSVFRNLISNAVKHGRNGKPPVVEIGFEDLSDRWLFYVKDNGPGLPKSKRKVVFAPFKRLNKSTEGLGLGLALSRRIVRAHGGDMGYESEPGKGAVFWFTLRKPQSARTKL